MSGNSERKTDPASARKLRKLREQGTLAQAAEMANFASQILAILIVIGTAGWILVALKAGIDAAILTIRLPFETALEDGAQNGIRIFLLSAAPVALAAMCSGLLVKMIFQRGFVFAVDPIVPKMENLSPGKALKRIFGLRGWVELGIAIARLAIWTGACAWLAHARFFQILGSASCGGGCIANVALDTLLMMLIFAVIIYAVFAVLEGLIQKFLFAQEQRMTKSEVNRERKEQFGSREVRAARRKFQTELERSADSVGVGKATMCIYSGDRAVAIRYHPDYATVPILAAKAQSRAQTRLLRQKVRENGWKETQDEAIVRIMVSRVPGDRIPDNLYASLKDALIRMYG